MRRIPTRLDNCNGESYLHKVGRKTGWTTGVNTEHCVDYTLSGASTGGKTLLLLCQTGSDVRIEGGDSGGPVFKALYQQSVDQPVLLLGTMVAGGTRNGAPYSLFSPMINRSHEVYAPLLNDLNFAHQ
jgi:hypothetical protein